MSEHRERVRWPGWLLLAVGLMALMLVGSSIGLLRVTGAPASGPVRLFHLFAILLLVVMAGLCWYFRYLEVAFGPEGIAYGFGRARQQIPFDRILSAEGCAYNWVRYMGWGWRIGPKRGERAYSVLGCARGVYIVYRRADASEASVFLSCTDPEAALRALGVGPGSVGPSA